MLRAKCKYSGDAACPEYVEGKVQLVMCFLSLLTSSMRVVPAWIRGVPNFCVTHLPCSSRSQSRRLSPTFQLCQIAMDFTHFVVTDWLTRRESPTPKEFDEHEQAKSDGQTGSRFRLLGHVFPRGNFRPWLGPNPYGWVTTGSSVRFRLSWTHEMQLQVFDITRRRPLNGVTGSQLALWTKTKAPNTNQKSCTDMGRQIDLDDRQVHC